MPGCAKRVKVAELEVGMKVPRWVCACENCGEMFMGYREAVFCSDACRVAAHRRRAA